MDPNRERFRQDPNDIFTSSIKKSAKPSKPNTSRSSQPEPSWVLSAFPVDQQTMEPLVTDLPELPLNYDAQIQTVLPAWAAEVRKCDTCFSVSGQLPRSTQLHGPHIAGRAAFSSIRMKKRNKFVELKAGDVVKLPLSGGRGNLRLVNFPEAEFISGCTGYANGSGRGKQGPDDTHLSRTFYGQVGVQNTQCSWAGTAVVNIWQGSTNTDIAEGCLECR
jgi:hypothetical protein